MCPVNPAKELHNMNNAATPEAFFTVVQFAEIIIGDRKTPPPTPIKPETMPITDPIVSPYAICIGFVVDSVRLTYSLNKSRKEETIRNKPAINLKNLGLRVRYPPRNAIGTEAIMKVKNIFLSKYPAFRNLMEVIDATTILSISEVGFIVSGANESNAINAR